MKNNIARHLAAGGLLGLALILNALDALPVGDTRIHNAGRGFEDYPGDDGVKTGQPAAKGLGWKNTGLPWTYKLDKHQLAITA